MVKKEQSYTSTPPMGRLACTEPQCLCKVALYLTFIWHHIPEDGIFRNFQAVKHADKFTVHLSCRNKSVSLMCPFQTYAAAWEGQEWPEVFSMQPGLPATQVPGKAHRRAQVPQ